MLRMPFYAGLFSYVVFSPEIIKTYDLGQSFVELSAIYFGIGVFASVFFTAPISDFLDRRKILLLYFLSAVSGALIVSLTHNIGLFYLGRFFIGVGVGNLFPIANASMHDVFCRLHSREAAYGGKVLSWLALASGWLPPIILLAYAGISLVLPWRSAMLILVGQFALCGLVVVPLAYKTWSSRTPKNINVKSIASAYWNIITSIKCQAYSIIYALSATIYDLIFIFFTFLMYHYTKSIITAAAYTFILVAANIVGKQMNNIFIRFSKARYTLFIAITMQLLSALALFVLYRYHYCFECLVAFVILTCVIELGIGIISPLASARVMSLFPDYTNMANSLRACIQSILLVVLSGIGAALEATTIAGFTHSMLLFIGILFVIAVLYIIFHRAITKMESSLVSKG